jgi:hypothetical protein
LYSLAWACEEAGWRFKLFICRQKIEGTGWRYRPLAVGRRPEAAEYGPTYIRVRDSGGKYQWVRHDTEQAAQKAAKAAPVARQAQELGLTVDDLTNEANTNRISVKTAVENYLQDRRFGPAAIYCRI